MKRPLLFLLVFISVLVSAQTVSSPDGNIQLTFSLDGSRPQYELSYKGKPVILPSHLGMELARDKHASKGEVPPDLETKLENIKAVVDTEKVYGAF